jgi:prepilin-type N-terminal cleavage/methylation domain-containing protein
MSENRGLTVLELLISMAIFSILITMGFTGFKSFQNRSQVTNSIRTVTSALNTARYQAIEENRSIKVFQAGSRFLLKIKINKKWETIKTFNLDEEVEVYMNASPVFHATGYVSPLCSITIKSEKYSYKISISIAGRIKVIKL